MAYSLRNDSNSMGVAEEFDMSIQAVKFAIPVRVFIIVGMVGFPVLGGHEKPKAGDVNEARE